MAKRRIIIGLIVCFLIAVLVGQTLSQTRERGRTRKTTNRDSLNEQRPRKWQRMAEQRRRLMQRKKEREQNREQRQRDSQKRQERAMKEALGATEEQWKVIKPRLEKVQNLARQANISISLLSYSTGSGSSRQSISDRRGTGYGGGSSGVNVRTAPSKPGNEETYSSSQSGWRWYKPSERKAPSELTEGERICEELLKLIGDKNSKPEEIKQKMEALQKIRQEAKKQLAKAQQELGEVLTFHQEAALIMMRRLY